MKYWLGMKSCKTLAAIAVVAAAVTVVISGSFVASALAISQQGTSNAQRPGQGVCNADEKIHEHTNLFSKTDQNFHRGVEKNFGPPSSFVGPTSTCQNPGP
jgi:hypothetical protein